MNEAQMLEMIIGALNNPEKLDKIKIYVIFGVLFGA